METLSKLTKIPNPEGWLERTQLMHIIKSDDYQAQVENHFDNIDRRKFGGCLFWSLALREMVNWIDYVAFEGKSKHDWSNQIHVAICNLKTLDEKDCAKFWIAQYSLLRALVDKRIIIEHCQPAPKQNKRRK